MSLLDLGDSDPKPPASTQQEEEAANGAKDPFGDDPFGVGGDDPFGSSAGTGRDGDPFDPFGSPSVEQVVYTNT